VAATADIIDLVKQSQASRRELGRVATHRMSKNARESTLLQ
jgi:hypothetical protein